MRHSFSLNRLSGGRELRQRVRPDGRHLFCTDPAGCANCAGVFALTGRHLFCTDPAGCANCVSVFALTGRLLFLHRLSGVRELR